MTSAFSWQNSVSLCPGSFCTPKAKLACFSRYLLTSYFCIPVPYDEKDIFFFVCVSSRRSSRASENCSTSSSLALVAGA